MSLSWDIHPLYNPATTSPHNPPIGQKPWVKLPPNMAGRFPGCYDILPGDLCFGSSGSCGCGRTRPVCDVTTGGWGQGTLVGWQMHGQQTHGRFAGRFAGRYTADARQMRWQIRVGVRSLRTEGIVIQLEAPAGLRVVRNAEVIRSNMVEDSPFLLHRLYRTMRGGAARARVRGD